MNKKSIRLVVFAVILSGLIFIMGIDRKGFASSLKTVYQVYLSGKLLGVIEEENELYDLIDKEQENLKKEYNVSKVYAPTNLETTKIVTYQGEVDDVKDVYEKIKDVEPFTIKGYEITINYSEDKKESLYVLNLEDFDEAVENTIKAFVNEEEYDKYIAGTQDKITTTGQTIDNIYLKEEITTKEKYLSTNDKIFTDSNELSKYLLFGTNEQQGVHIVKTGETIKDIADEYQLNVNEFLIVNPDIISANALLFNGQEVNVGLIDPIVNVVVENTLVEDKVVTYNSEIKYDDKLLVGTTYTETTGRDGKSRVTYYTESVNGQMIQAVSLKNEVLTPVVNEVIVKGGLSYNYLGESSGWYWPTIKPYKIVSPFGWRADPGDGSRDFHSGIDIAGVGYGSPIYASQAGTIIEKNYRWDMGNHITIKHNDVYTTIYMHMSEYAEGIGVGSWVEKGQLIGYVGNSGYSFGAHLHFTVEFNGTRIDPLLLEYN